MTDELTFREFVPPQFLHGDEDPHMIARSLLGAIAEFEIADVLDLIRDIHLNNDIGETDHIDLILDNLGNPFQFVLTEKLKRRLARALPTIYQAKGTAPGIVQAILLLTGLIVGVVPDGTSENWWVLGESELGTETYLGGAVGTGEEVTFFVLFKNRNPTDDEFARVQAIVEFMKPHWTRALYEFLALSVSTQPPDEVEENEEFSVTVDARVGGKVSEEYSRNVTIALGEDPTGGTATLGGTTTVSAVDGVATFDDLTIDEAGEGFTLTASADGLASVETDAFEVTI